MPGKPLKRRRNKVAQKGSFDIVAVTLGLGARRGAGMDNGDPENNGMEYQEHERTYNLFITLFQWGAGIVALVLILMAIFLL